MDETKQVSVDKPEDGVSKETPAPAQPVAENAATQEGNRQVDAEAFKKEAEQLKKDLNAMKASFQKREDQITKESKSRLAELEAALEEARLAGMDDSAKKAYESSRGAKKVMALEAELAELREKQSTQESFRAAVEQFRDAGVPLEALETNADLPTLVQSGWDWMVSHMRELEEKAKASPEKKDPDKLPEPPVVPTAKGKPVGKATWKELEDKYGSREQVFTLIEQNRLSPDILP